MGGNPRKFILLYLPLLLFSSFREAHGVELSLGAGGSFSSLSQGDTTGTGNAIYMGPGLQGELRARFFTKYKRFSIDVFGLVDQSYLTNTNSTMTETNRRLGYGGGFDLGFGHFFLGAQCELLTSTIETNGTNSAILKYPEFGVRAGYRMHLSRRWSLTLGGVAALGKTSFDVSGQTVSSTAKDFRGFLILQFSFYSSHSKYQGPEWIRSK